MSESYYVRDRSHVQGPFDVEELARRVRARRLARHHQLSADGIEWHRASDLLPTLFPVQQSPRQPPRSGGDGDLIIVDDDDPDKLTVGDEVANPIAPPKKLVARNAQSNVLIFSLLGVGLLAALCAAGVIVFAYLSPTGDRAIAAKIRPAMVTIKGIHPKTGKKKCLGLVVSRHHVVAPVEAATLDGLKVEALHDDSRKEWHSAHVVVADPVAALCVLRCDLGTDVEVAHLEDSRTLPPRHAELKSIALGDDDGDDERKVVEAWELMKVLNKGEPDEQMLLGREEASKADESEVAPGMVIVDKDIRIVGIVLAGLADGSCVTAPAYEIRTKKKESGKLPADHVLGRIDLPERTGPVAQSASSPGNPAKQQAEQTSPAEEPHAKEPVASAPRPDEAQPPTSQESPPDVMDKSNATQHSKKTSRDTPSRDDQNSETSSSTTDVADVMRAGALVGHAVDSLVPLPELPPDTAKQLGDSFLEDVCKEHKPIKQGAVVVRLRKLIDEVCSAAGLDRKSIRLTVVEDDELQAYAFVGGNIVVNTGFIKFSDGDEDMERFVIGHEIGHIALGHVDKPFRRALLAGTLLPGGELVGSQVSVLIQQSPLNQPDEEAADCFIVRVMRKKKWSTAGGVRFFERVKNDRQGDDDAASSETIESLFGSHPDHVRRIEVIEGGCE